MASISDCQKSTVDRISNLPSSLISHILSFLSTKDAVRTSVLSTCWIQQWTSITNLDFDDGYPLHGESGNSPTSEVSFVNFVYRVFLFKVTRIDLFRLHCGRDYGGFIHVNSWLSAAISRHVRQIDLSVTNHYIRFPSRPWPRLESDFLFSSKTLAVLKLGRGFILRVPKIITLPSLKIIHFMSIEFEDSESLSRLVSSCPVLDELKMGGALRKSMRVLSISSLVLKRLILIGLYPEYYQYEVVLNTPSLELLQHVDLGVPDRYRIEMGVLHCLDRAHLCLQLSYDQFEQYDDKLVLAKSIADLAVAISNVRFLYLSEFTFEAFYHPDCVMPNFELPKFPHLTVLKIGAIAFGEGGLSLLKAFLQSSPQLTYLSFALEHEYSDRVWDPPTVVPFCMQHNLNRIEVHLFSGRPLELSMVRYFLGETISLKELRISEMEEANPELVKKVLMFPKASKSCTIVFT